MRPTCASGPSTCWSTSTSRVPTHSCAAGSHSGSSCRTSSSHRRRCSRRCSCAPGARTRFRRRRIRTARRPGRTRSRCPEAAFTLGAEFEPWAYDNELEAHETELRPFVIDRAPVTNAQFAEFVDGRGYRAVKHWSAAGLEWRDREGARAPLYWEGGSDGWERVRFGVREPLPPTEPVQHVSSYEAEAYAHWAGKRLPTEVEWERAAAWHDHEGKFRYPWGQAWMGFEASLDRRRFSPAPAGSYAGGVSPVGCVQMAGDVWEWTSSAFRPYPGFVAFPGPECSEVNFGDDVRVLRGGSWATDGLVARASLRRWEHPARREIFAGFRCARDA